MAHVALIEFDNRLRADAALQDKLPSLPNATIVTSGPTQKVHGDKAKAALAAFDHLIRIESVELAKPA